MVHIEERRHLVARETGIQESFVMCEVTPPFAEVQDVNLFLID